MFVVDDDASMRDSLRRLLGSEGFQVETFSSARAFMEGFERSDVPSCLVLDVFLPGLTGLALQQELRQLDAAPAIVFLTGRGDIPMSVKAIKDGAVEFLTKPFRPDVLVASVKDAIERARGAIAERRRRVELVRRHRSLTGRERAVMSGVIAGLLNKQIAARFGTREVTVKEQRAQVMRKMAARSAAELVRMGLELGVAPLDESS